MESNAELEELRSTLAQYKSAARKMEEQIKEAYDLRDKERARCALLEALLRELRQCNANEVWPVLKDVDDALSKAATPGGNIQDLEYGYYL